MGTSEKNKIKVKQNCETREGQRFGSRFRLSAQDITRDDKKIEINFGFEK